MVLEGHCSSGALVHRAKFERKEDACTRLGSRPTSSPEGHLPPDMPRLTELKARRVPPLACNYKKSYIMVYEWDETKARRNLAKHGLSFEDAPLVFESPTVTFEDDRFDYGEQRLITLGLLAGRIVIIAHTARGDDATRIISMRKANRREQEIYQERLGEG